MLGGCGWWATLHFAALYADRGPVGDTLGVLATGIGLVVAVAVACSNALLRPGVRGRWMLPVLAFGGAVTLPVSLPLLLLPVEWQARTAHVPPLLATIGLAGTCILPYVTQNAVLAPLWSRVLGRISHEEAYTVLEASAARHRFSMDGEGDQGFLAIMTEIQRTLAPVPTCVVGPNKNSGSDAWMAFMQKAMAEDMDKALGWRVPPSRPVLVEIPPATAHQRLAAAARHVGTGGARADRAA